MSLIAGLSRNGPAYSGTGLASDIAPADSVTHNWMGIYLGGDKVGYTVQSFAPSPLGLAIKNYSLLRLPMGQSVREVFIDQYAIMDSALALKSFAFTLSSGDYETDVFGNIGKNGLEITIHGNAAGTQPQNLRIPTEGPIYLVVALPLIIAADDFSSTTYRFPTFDPFRNGMADIRVDVIGRRIEIVQGDKMEVHTLRLTTQGVSTEMDVDEDGRVISEREPGGLRLVLETEKEALDLPLQPNLSDDILDRLAVHADRKIADPRRCVFLKAELGGVNIGRLKLESSVQSLVSIDPPIVVIDVRNPGRLEGFSPDSSTLVSTPFVQADDAAIRQLALSIARGAETDLEKGIRIGRWVFENVEKDLTVSIPSATEVLSVLKGDCNEHTVLFTALARSLGIHTRISVGIVYKDDLFYYHAWPEIWVGYWHPLDPTFGQDTMDATHIKLLEGNLENQVELATLVGFLEVKVMEYRTDED